METTNSAMDLGMFDFWDESSLMEQLARGDTVVPGGEELLLGGGHRTPLASTSSSVGLSEEEGSVISDPALEHQLEEFLDIEELLKFPAQTQNILSEASVSAAPVGCQGNYLMIGHDEMWNATHTSAAGITTAADPVTVSLVPQAEAAGRAPKRAEMGDSPSPDRDSVSGPAPKRARLPSDESISAVLDSIERKREKNNEACRKARQNKRMKEAELKAKAEHLVEDNARLRRKIASLERKVSEEKKKFLQVMTSS